MLRPVVLHLHCYIVTALLYTILVGHPVHRVRQVPYRLRLPRLGTLQHLNIVPVLVPRLPSHEQQVRTKYFITLHSIVKFFRIKTLSQTIMVLKGLIAQSSPVSLEEK